MKILHTADWHLGTKNLKLPVAQRQMLKNDILLKTQDLFRKASKENFEVVLICGDLFHAKNISQKTISIFMNAVEEFARPVLYIQGNHDENINLDKVPLNFIILNKDNFKYEYNGTVFYYPIENIVIDPNMTNVLLVHGNIENNKDNDYVNINKFLPLSFDYIALGHIHTFKKYKKDDSIFAYSGSLFSNGFDECGDKGYLEVVIENKRIEKLDFVPFASKRYMICECDITGLNNSREIVKEIQLAIDKNKITKNDFVRVVLVGTFGEDCEKSLGLIEQFFSDFFYFEITDQSTLKLDIEKIRNEKLSFKYEFISLVENSDLDEDDKRKVCEIGLEALKGEGLSI